MRVVLSNQAEKQLHKISKIDQIALARKIREMVDSKSLLHAEKLHGYEHVFRVRLGNYRIVYRTFPDKLYIIVISHRKDVYILLRKLLD